MWYSIAVGILHLPKEWHHSPAKSAQAACHAFARRRAWPCGHCSPLSPYHIHWGTRRTVRRNPFWPQLWKGYNTRQEYKKRNTKVLTTDLCGETLGKKWSTLGAVFTQLQPQPHEQLWFTFVLHEQNLNLIISFESTKRWKGKGKCLLLNEHCRSHRCHSEGPFIQHQELDETVVPVEKDRQSAAVKNGKI